MHLWLSDDIEPLSKLGKGAYGDVHKAMYGATEVAVKFVRDVGREDMASRLFRREVGLLIQLRHPHVLVVIGLMWDEATGRPFIVTELCNGQSVAERLESLKPLCAMTICM